MKIRVIRNLIMLFYCFLCIFLQSDLSFGYGLTGAKWADSALPVPYYINQNGSDNISGDEEFTSVQTSFQTWTSVATTYATVSYQGTTTRKASPTVDGYNVISWVDSSSDEVYTYNDPLGFGDLMTTGTIAVSFGWTIGGYWIESEIAFNGVDYTWSTTGEAGKMDIQNIATHEIGHFFGLGDLYNSTDAEKTMYGYGTNGETKKRDLHQDDIDGISAIYPYAGVIDFTATPVAVGDASWIVLSWKNPNRSTYSKTMIRYRSDGVHPASTSDGTLLVEKTGTPNVTDYYSHTGIVSDTTYYYTAFAYDTQSGYTEANTTSQKSALAIGAGGSIGGGGGSCFIASLCYGKNSAQVEVLKKFRDNYMAKTMLGRNCIKIYYIMSPAIAKNIENNCILKTMVRLMLEPIVNCTSYLVGGK